MNGTHDPRARDASHARRGPLLAWQLEHYPHNHVDRRNLVIHVVTVPIFMLGTLALLAGLVTLGWPLALAGLLAMPLAVAAQGRGHARERVAPIPFAGPLDVVARIAAEQWITFPRFVLRGGLRTLATRRG
jgi:hypothetical protein